MDNLGASRSARNGRHVSIGDDVEARGRNHFRSWRATAAAITALAMVTSVTSCGQSTTDGRGSAAADATATSAAPTKITVPTVVILDGSGSMTTDDAPGPRIAAAKAATQGLIDSLPDDAVIGLTTYGTTTTSTEAEKATGCRDVSTLIALGPLDRDRMAQQIAAVTPSGYTPIALALERAAAQLPADGSAQAIVLVSDGEDSCGTPPCDTAAALKRTHPGLTISAVGFKTDGPASDQLSCIAAATGGLFVGADNAAQLASRLIAVQNVDEAKSSLTGTGIDGITLGQTLDEIRSGRADFPDGSRSGKTVIVYIDCEFGFIDGVLDYIAPRNGGRTIDGVTRGTDLHRVTELYGTPVAVDRPSSTVVYRADDDTTGSDAGFRITVEDFVELGGRIAGRVGTIVLCRCAPRQPVGSWTDPTVIVTPNSVGTATLGMTDEEIAAVAGVQFRTDFHGAIALLPPEYPFYESAGVNDGNGALWYRFMRVGLNEDHQPGPQTVQTEEGFRLGDSVDELRRVYGDRIQPYRVLGMNSVDGYVLAGDGGYLVFNAIDTDGSTVTEFLVTEKIFP